MVIGMFKILRFRSMGLRQSAAGRGENVSREVCHARQSRTIAMVQKLKRMP